MSTSRTLGPTYLILALVAAPFVVVALSVAVMARAPVARLIAAAALAAMGSAAWLFSAPLFAINRHIDLCADQTSACYPREGDHHPDCDDPDVDWS